MHPLLSSLAELGAQLSSAVSSYEETATLDPQVTPRLQELREAFAFLTVLQDAITVHGIGVVQRCLSLHPLAAVRGDSARELDLATSRFSEGLYSMLSVSLDPRARFPVEVTFLGGKRPGTSGAGERLAAPASQDSPDRLPGA